MSTPGIPVKLLNEAHGHTVSLELTSGETYRGKLVESEDNMNCQLTDVTLTARNGKVTHMDHIFIRGSHVKFFVVPDMFKSAPLFRTGPVHKPPPPIRGPKRR
ncbi:HBR104Cp [Eremothecium sinecaudum]|uniref:Small nuclear ribonucleoprotein Sm D3 n=1 Tax=Eremothecium sinecaudum TaxID=45286 RepID=A0A120K150_9SACH|nr:HBR104Cp [Eremothecium sinecaudum]AMD19005.1 HBR104Cp [Eremothecium sinecaudum]